MVNIVVPTLTLCIFAAVWRRISGDESKECRERSLIGQSNINPSDIRFTASSHVGYRYVPDNAKLNGKYGWAPIDNTNPGDYLQIDLGAPRVITAVATQGNGGDPESEDHKVKYEWVTQYNLYLMKDLSTLQIQHHKMFEGNTDYNSVVRRDLTNPQLARYIRFVPTTYHNYKTMRINIYFFEEDPELCVTTIPDKRSVQINWIYKSCIPNNAATGYSIKVGNRTHRLASHDRTYNVTSLKPYTEYDITIKANTQMRNGVWSSTKRIKTTIAEPEAVPTFTRIQAGSPESITIKWKLSKDNMVNGPLKGYKITYKPQGGKIKTIDVGNVTTYTLTSLLKYTTYNITVAVNNTKYIGPPSNEERIRTMEDAPSAPVNVNGTLIPAQGLAGPRIVITWDKPRDQNGIIRTYTIVYSYNMDTSNKVIVTINGTSDIKYTMNITGNGILSYNISATTIKAGPYAAEKYLYIPYGCPEQSLVGKKRNLNIPDSSYTASSTFDYRFVSHNAKLHGKYGWAPRDNKNPADYLQIDLGVPRVSTAVATQGSGFAQEWVTKYKLYFAKDNIQRFIYKYPFCKVFEGNTDPDSVVRHNLTNPQLARYIRFVPTAYHSHKAMRVDVYVTNQKPPRVKAFPDKRSIKLTWTYQRCSPTDHVTGYLLKVGNRTHKIINDDLSYNWTNLKPYTEYNVSVKAIKHVGYGVWSNMKIKTKMAVKAKQSAEEKSPLVRNFLIAGPVAGIIVILLILIVGIAFWKRRHRQKKRKHVHDVVMDLVPHAVPLAVIVDEPSTEDHDKLDLSANSHIYTENNTENEINEKSPIPDVMLIKSLVEFDPPDINKIIHEFESIPVEPKYETNMAKKPANKAKNRYKNIIAYDHSLVSLEQLNDDTDSCYINASFIRGYDETPESYVATQGPLSNTLNDFWRMVWEQHTSSIIMLTNLLELGKRKCHQYWPDNSTQCSDITVANHKTEVFADFVIRTFLLSKGDTQNRKVLQFHFTAWPDKGVPHHATSALAFRRKVLALSSGENRPMVIHCSAGVGRTGTYIMIDAMLRQAQNQQNVDIVSYLHAIRDDRPYMVQTLEQYTFVHMAVHEALTCGNTEIQVQDLRIVMPQLSTVDKQHKISGYALEFQLLESVTSQSLQDSFDVGLIKENAKKNRYSNIVAANVSRVILSTEEDADKENYINATAIDIDSDAKGDYINASFVDTYRERNAFIMTQAPMENTIADFWRMIMDYEIGTIVMLNNMQEEYESFPQYWPTHGTKTYGDVTVELLETKGLGNIITRQFEVTKQEVRRAVCHLQSVIWADKCIPADPQTVLNLLDETQKSQRQQTGNSPIVVQCSNGVGRSGTLCAIASCLERVKQEQVLDVFQTVKSIRVNRPGAIETLTQYVFCYNILQKYLDSFHDYANFGDN